MYMLSIVNFISDKTSTSYKFDISKIVDYINLNYENSYLCLDMLATEFKLSPKYISKKINDYLGVSFKDYITQLRVAKAIDLLINSDIKANDVFNRAGFSSQSSFNRVFKQRTGISPMKYRETHKNDKKGTAEK